MAGITGLGQKIETAKRVGAQASDFTQTTSSITGTYSGASGSTTMVNDFIGMDYTQVETIRTSIREYVNNLHNIVIKSPDRIQIGDIFTSYKLLNILM